MCVLVTCIFLHYGNSAQVKNTVIAISGDVFLRCVIPVECLNYILQTLHLPNRKDPHPATYKFNDPIDIPPNSAKQ